MVLAILALSIFFEVIAAYLALRLIGPSKGTFAWVLIAVAFVLRAVRLSYEFWLYVNPAIDHPLDLLDELMGLAISILLALGVYLIGPLFEAFARAEKTRELYAHSISHDLRGPLTVIRGYAEMLSEKKEGEPVDRDVLSALEAIRHSSGRMNAMIEDLVDAARFSGKGVRLATAPLRLQSHLPDMVQQLLIVSERDRIELDIAPDLPPVMADAVRLDRIVLNLLSNALKYSPPKTTVVLGAHRKEGEVIVSVRDFGEGIDPRELPRVFERYFSGAEGRTKGGIGLGLYIVRELVKAHGGRVWAQSCPGEGSTFSFTLPIADHPN